MAIDRDGALYFGLTRGEVRKLTPEQTQETGLGLDDTEQVATLPGSAIGVELVAGDALYVASQAEAGTGVWRVPTDGSDPDLFAAVGGSLSTIDFRSIKIQNSDLSTTYLRTYSVL